MNKHTPGPWTAHKYETSECREIRAASGPAVASTHSYNLSTTTTEIANAQLIAAAPRLPAALRDAHAALDLLLAQRIAVDSDFRPTQHGAWPTVVEAYEAIKQATGQ